MEATGLTLVIDGASRFLLEDLRSDQLAERPAQGVILPWWLVAQARKGWLRAGSSLTSALGASGALFRGRAGSLRAAGASGTAADSG